MAAGPARTVAGLRLARETPPRIDLSYGRADVSSFPRAAWLRAIRGALASAPNDLFGYLAGSGVPELRTAIAGYLNRVRGTVAEPDQIVTAPATRRASRCSSASWPPRGATRLALEDPSSGDDALPAARAAGLEVTGIPVDRDGIRVDLLAASGADAVVLTPSHQWPTGSVLSAERRAAVLRWAAASGAVVIEDDYDAEYRYDRTPVGALQGMAPDRVVYAGSASKTLAPGLRLGWFVMPGHLAEPMAEAKIAADRGSPALEQLALADLIAKGEFDRHLRRMRPVYRRRRDALLAALSRRLPWLELAGVSAGCTWSPGCRRAWTRRPWSTRRPGPGWASRASRRTGSATRVPAASSSATPPSTRRPSRRASTSWRASSPGCDGRAPVSGRPAQRAVTRRRPAACRPRPG